MVAILRSRIGAAVAATAAVLTSLAFAWGTLAADSCPKPKVPTPNVMQAMGPSSPWEEELRVRLASSQKLVDFKDMGPDADGTGKAFTNFSMNARSWACQLYPEGGEAKLRYEASVGIDQGLRCLANLGARYPKGTEVARIRAEVAWLLQYFNVMRSPERFTFSCNINFKGDDEDQYAVAVPCHDLDKKFGGVAPGMVLNNSSLAGKDSNGRSSTIFHELLHMLGYKHTERAKSGVDFVKEAQSCCFGNVEASCKRIAFHQHEGSGIGP